MERRSDPARGTGDIAIAVVLKPDLPIGFAANTAATIACGLASVRPEVAGDRLQDKMGFEYASSADRPVPILQASQDKFRQLLTVCASRPDDAEIVVFPEFARRLHAYAEYQTSLEGRDLAKEDIGGLGLIGPVKWVRSVTGSLKLLR